MNQQKSRKIGLLMFVVVSAALLWALAALVWPVSVVYADDPEILTITVTSSRGTYFYDPGLDPTGGTVYFNSVGGEGAGQVLTVTVTCSGTATRFEGAPAFNDTPPLDFSAPWQVTYTVEAGAGTQSGIAFTVTNVLSGTTDTAAITFTQDNTDPAITSPAITEGSVYLHADGLTVYYGDDMMASQAFTVQGDAQDSGAGLHHVAYTAALNQPYYEDFSHLGSWYRDYTANRNNTTSGVITVTIYDRVGNSATQIFTYTRDTISPTISSPLIAESSPYLHADGTTVYYSNQMGSTSQSFAAQGSAADNTGGAGLYRATFSPALGSSPDPDDTPAEWSGSYSVESSDSGNGTITVKVYDNVSNWSQQTFDYTEDTTNPTVALTYVTPGSYDEDDPDNWLDDDGSNWYKASDFTGGNWAFTSDTADGGAGRASGSASWDHSANQTDRTLPCGIGGDGTFSGVSGDANGTVTVTVTITDHVGNSANDQVVFNIDNTDPTITSPSISESSPYLHADGFTLYYGDEMGSVQVFYVNGSSNDTGVGLDRARFSEAFGATPSDDTTPSAWSGRYDPDNQDWGNGTITVTVSDRLGNAAYQTFNYLRDTEPPTVDVNCPAVTSVPSWTVSWSASDPPPASGLNHYDVQYKVGAAGSWQNWHMNTLLTQDTFGPTSPINVEDDQTYYFRARAVDNVSNQQQYTTGDDATTYHSGVKKVFLPIIVAPDPNWGFETCNFTSWQHGGQLERSISTNVRHSGSCSALLGNPAYVCQNGVPIGSAWLRRSVTVPSSGSPTLSFWYRIYTQDKNSALSDEYDLFAVYINGSQLVVKDANTSDPFGCSALKDLGWKQRIFSLNAYKGQTIQITFYVYNRPDKWYNTYVYIDDVSVQ